MKPTLSHSITVNSVTGAGAGYMIYRSQDWAFLQASLFKTALILISLCKDLYGSVASLGGGF